MSRYEFVRTDNAGGQEIDVLRCKEHDKLFGDVEPGCPVCAEKEEKEFDHWWKWDNQEDHVNTWYDHNLKMEVK